MKKVFLVSFLALAMASCGNVTESTKSTEEACDCADSTVVIDTTIVETVVVDSTSVEIAE